VATTTLPPGADITFDDQGSGKPPELTPRPGYVAQSGSPSQKSETGMLVAVSAIGMSFAAFTSAMFVRQDSSTDWQRFQLPYVLYLNTLILIGSSVALQLSRQRFAAIPQAAQRASASVKVLLASGIYWLLHAVHLLGGMGGLFYVLRKLIRNGGVAETSGLSAFSIYWHFMDLLWVYLLLLLAIRI
jgi:cytochrome c oxidase subunit 3